MNDEKQTKRRLRNHLDRQYKFGDKIITYKDAVEEYPHPIFHDRPNIIQTKDCLESELLFRVKEIRFWLDQYEKCARGQVAGNVTKAHLLDIINRLHTWRSDMNVMAARNPGEPILWEV